MGFHKKKNRSHCHISLKILHPHCLFGVRIFYSDTQANLQFWDTERAMDPVTPLGYAPALVQVGQ